MDWFKRNEGRDRPVRRPIRRQLQGRRQRGRGAGEEQWKKLLPFAAFAAIAVAVLFAWSLIPETVLRNRETMCPVDGPRSVTAVLIDTTGNFNAMTRADVIQEMEALLAESTTDDMITVYEMRGDVPEDPPDGQPQRWPLPEPLLTVCNPGDPETASDLFENPAMIERAMNEKYLAPVRGLVSDLVREDSFADWSPLMETVQTVQINVLGAPVLAGLNRRIVMITDLIQNSPVLTFNRGSGAARRRGGLPEYESFAETPAARTLSADLSGVDVEILFVEREAHAAIAGGKTRALVDWWDLWFADQGATVTNVKRLAGMS